MSEFWEEMKRYWEIARVTWEDEVRNPKPPARTMSERAFLPAAIEITDTPASPAGRILASLIVGLFVITIVWSIFGKIDINATLVGRIIPTGQVKVIEPLETGTVRAIYVRDGQQVVAGELMIELDPTDSTADRERLAHDLMAAELQAARLRETVRAGRDGLGPREVALKPDIPVDIEMLAMQSEVLLRTVASHRASLASLAGEREQRVAELARIAGSIEEREKLVGVIAERVDMFKTLLERATGTRAGYLQVAQLLYEERANLRTEQGQAAEVESAIAATFLREHETVAVFLSQAVTDLSDVETRIAGLTQELIKATRREARNRLHAPVAGTVRQLAVHTVGEVVTTDQQLMIVVPTGGGLEVEAMLLNKDKGFVLMEQAVEIKIDAFPFTKYGTIDGLVLDVSNDAIEQEGVGLVFPVRVSMDSLTMRAAGEDRALTPGMSVTVEVKTGHRRVIEYLLTPLLRYRDEAIRER
ncbi:MAG: hemolysin secretion protein D [Rhodobiaceae bacterium]|nr:MAG: hemolysin secretion protein D [Rhodobiaceae bacterium]